MAIGSTSRASLAYIPEATFGVTPVSGTVYALRVNGMPLKYDISKDKSKEINAYRSVSSMVPISAKSSGGIDAEMQYAEHDKLVASALQGTYAAYGTNGVGTTATVSFTATTLTASSAPTGGSAYTTLKKGQWFRVSAGADANNGLVLRVSKTVAPTSTVITLDTATPAVVSASVAGVALQTSRLTNGTTQTSFSLEQAANDITQFHLFKGMTPSKMDITIASGALSMLKLEFMGAGFARATSTGLPATPTPSLTYDIHSSVSGSSCVLMENGIPLTQVKSIAMSYDNSLREQSAVCSLAPVGVGSGDINCEVTAEIYFSSGTIYDQFLANSYQEFVFSSIDGSGNGYVFTLPYANIKSHDVTFGSKDQDLMAKVVFTGLRDANNVDPTLRQLIFIDRIGVAVV